MRKTITETTTPKVAKAETIHGHCSFIISRKGSKNKRCDRSSGLVIEPESEFAIRMVEVLETTHRYPKGIPICGMHLKELFNRFKLTSLSFITIDEETKFTLKRLYLENEREKKQRIRPFGWGFF